MGKLWYIRHGQTDFNAQSFKWHAEGDPESGAFYQFIPELIDPPLNASGISQIISNKQPISSLEIDLVFVSPLLRTLQSCDLLFGDLENPPKIIVNPFFNEWVHVNHDIPKFPNDYREQFKKFDWSFMPKYNYLKDIVKNQYSELIREDSSSNEILEIVKNLVPNVLESRIELFNRVNFCKEILKNEAVNKNVAVVGHSAFYRHFTSKLNSEGEFYDSKILLNGEFSEFEFNND